MHFADHFAGGQLILMARENNDCEPVQARTVREWQNPIDEATSVVGNGGCRNAY